MSIWEKIEHMVTKVPILKENVIPALKKAKEKDRQRHKVKQTLFNVGDQVMIAVESKRLLDPKWNGPVTLVKKYDNGIYVYELSDKSISKAINENRLKLFKNWLDMESIVVIQN